MQIRRVERNKERKKNKNINGESEEKWVQNADKQELVGIRQ